MLSQFLKWDLAFFITLPISTFDGYGVDVPIHVSIVEIHFFKYILMVAMFLNIFSIYVSLTKLYESHFLF